MNSYSRAISRCVVALVLFIHTAKVFAALGADTNSTTAQITLLYDAFGKTSGMQKDWGYSALVEYSGKRI